MPETLSSRLAPLKLPNVNGDEVLVGSLWADRPAVVAFLRHWG